jgi:hypothetical protein
VKRTIFDPKDPAEPVFKIALPATFANLKAAKKEAREVLSKEGYETNFFSTYDVNNGDESWSHGDGAIVYARGTSGEVLKVEIDTIANSTRLLPDASGEIHPPLYHVLQTVIDYDKDRSGSQRYSIVEGTHATLELAREQALRVLIDECVTKEDFVEYNEYSDMNEGNFGPNVVVHAVKEGGQNLLISVISS